MPKNPQNWPFPN
ncbi:hypothetical protein F383_00067 [Gossypium arboreum]|nr:hypothetical protein F383_00067 [Gossypium arboreum]